MCYRETMQDVVASKKGTEAMRSRTKLIISVCGIAGVLGAAWLYENLSSAVGGLPELPPNPPERTPSKEVIELNNRAMEVALGKPEEALELLDSALETDPHYTVAIANKAQLLIRRKSYREAAGCFKKLCDLRPRAAEYYVGHALCLQREGNTRFARERLRYAISAYGYRLPEDPVHARINRALVFFLLGEESRAKEDLDNAQSVDSDNRVSLMISSLRSSFAEAREGDRWSVLGLDE